MTHNDFFEFSRMLAALLFVLALMGGLVIVLRKLGYAPIPQAQKRLKLVEILHLDAKRKIAIVQRDDVQHLIMMGAGGECVIESHIETKSETRQDDAIKEKSNGQ